MSSYIFSLHVYLILSHIQKILRTKESITSQLSMNRNDQRGTEVGGWGRDPKNVRGEIGGWGRVPFNEPYAPSLSTIYDGA